MGSFSWNKADKLTQIENIVRGKPFKFLIPKEFGGGFIKDVYQDYGYLGTKENGEPKYDMYELLAFWNKVDNLQHNGYVLLKEIDEYTSKNRSKGISIGCYDDEILKLKYPLKLASASYKGCYEDLETCSLGDPDQGFYPRKRLIVSTSKKQGMVFKSVKNNEPELYKENDTFYKSKKCLVLVGGVYPLVARLEKDTSIGDEYEAWYCEEYDDIVDDVTHFTEIVNYPKQ